MPIEADSAGAALVLLAHPDPSSFAAALAHRAVAALEDGVAYRYPDVPAWSGFLGSKRGMLVMTSSYEPEQFRGDRVGDLDRVLHPLMHGTLAHTGMRVLVRRLRRRLRRRRDPRAVPGRARRRTARPRRPVGGGQPGRATPISLNGGAA
jgi:putative NADPH-quinone reductase